MEVANGYGREGTGVVFAILDTNGNYLYKYNLFYIVLNNFLEKKPIILNMCPHYLIPSSLSFRLCFIKMLNKLSNAFHNYYILY